MIRIIKTDGIEEREFFKLLEERGNGGENSVVPAVEEIITQVKVHGDRAVAEYTEKFDKVRLESFELTPEQIHTHAQKCDPAVRQALLEASENIRDFHARQKQESWFVTKPAGVILGQRIRPLHRVGIYVPGGTAAYPSSVLMNAIPAKTAGVGEVVMVTPPRKNGLPESHILAAAEIAGVDRVFVVGGAQAVAALAYGTQTMPKVDKIVGPGNIFVATAKKLLYGIVDIDMIAGPSEILIIADESAEPAYIAADLMSQAEHDTLASSVLITTSMEIAKATVKELQKQVEGLSRKDIIRTSLEAYGAILVADDLDEAFRLAEELASEHVELILRDPLTYVGKLDNVGSLFLGGYAPEPLGDYFAGPNHVLPTNGTARFFSPLSVDSFLKKSSYMYYTEDALRRDSDKIITLAEAEEFTAHANSIRVRFQKEDTNCSL